MKEFLTLTIICVLVLAIAGYGYVANFIALVTAVAGDPTITAMILARAVGIFFAPLGVVLGYVG